MESSIFNQYPLLGIIKINDLEYITSFSSFDGHFELISYETGDIYNSSKTSCTKGTTSGILKNTFLSIKYKNDSYNIINAYIDKSDSKLIIQKLY